MTVNQWLIFFKNIYHAYKTSTIGGLFFAYGTLVNTGACASTVPMEGPVSASPFSSEDGGIDLVSPSP